MLSARIRALAVAAVLIAGQAEGQDVAQTATIVTTKHSVTIGGRCLNYTARAGTIPIRDNETGEVHANMFFVAYTVDRDPSTPARPLTFLWNGGPGSNSGLVHLLGFGPRRITKISDSTSGDGSPRTALIDNQETWLAFSDLVFVDPIGTGYSRPTKSEYSSEFYQSQGDADSVAEFIRVCRLRLEAHTAPIYLMGESYGVTRASLVAEALTKCRIQVAGVILLSGGLPLENDVSDHLRDALNLPLWTAAAHYHQKLAPELQERTLNEAILASKNYAEGDYAKALAQIDSLSAADRETVVVQLARFTGLSIAQIDSSKLQVSVDQLSTSLLGQNLMVGRYDSRAIGSLEPSGDSYDPTKDPSLKDILDSASVQRYLRGELGYKSDLLYQGPFGGGYPPPTTPRGDWMSVRWGSWKGLVAAAKKKAERESQREGSSPEPVEEILPEGLDAAMASDPDLRVFVANGVFDLVVNSYATDYAAQHLPPAIAPRVTSRIYPGGHATYTDDDARRQLHADVFQFFRGGARQ